MIVSALFKKRLRLISESDDSDILCGGRKGLEKESLRVDKLGKLVSTDHPTALGSALTSKYITTDFSEALLEFITPAVSSTTDVLNFMSDIHQFTYKNIDEELLWVSSMPCFLDEQREIPLARYGASNVGRMKTIYRNGLGLRYGRNMQAIAGIHFNYSLPEKFWPIFKQNENNQDSNEDFRSSSYMAMIRNFKRYGWLILYLFGASPALCKSFLPKSLIEIPEYDKNTLYQPYGTSLRMSDLGYTSEVQSNINISLNNLDEYVKNLRDAISTPESTYNNYGLLRDGEYQQLSLNKLQIENEYYSPVRPKRVALSGERPTTALERGGIEYIEIRSLDLNIYDPVGINQNTMRFMESFLIYCMLEDSPMMSLSDDRETMRNHTNTANFGRDPSMLLFSGGKKISLKVWAMELMSNTLKIAKLIDQSEKCSDYVTSVNTQIKLIEDPDATPSSRMMQDINNSGLSFAEYGFSLAEKQKNYFSTLTPLNNNKHDVLNKEAQESLLKQADIEAVDQPPLNVYLENYFKS